MIERIEMSLAAHFPRGRALTDADFLQHLQVGAREIDRTSAPGRTNRVVLLKAAFRDFEGPIDAPDHFAAYVERGFADAATWLAEQPVAVFESFTARGLELNVFIDMWIDGNQMNLELPPAFLRECGLRGVRLHAYTNE